jgi:hypothetical protein
MDDTKKFLTSKTIWGAMIALIATMLQIMGFDATGMNGTAEEIVTIVGAAMAIYGRIRAVKKIGK